VSTVLRQFALAACLALSSKAAIAQTAETLPRMPGGHPDLQGVWESRWATLLERPPGVPLVIAPQQAVEMHQTGIKRRANPPGVSNPESDSDYAPFVVVDGEFRSSLIVDPPDGRLPYTPEGLRLRSGWRPDALDNPEERTTGERCITAGRAPLLPIPTNSYIQIMQPPGLVVIQAEAMNELRSIPVDRPASISAFPKFMGDATAGWDGDTLVIETTNARRDIRWTPPGSTVVITPETRIVERFQPVSQSEIRYSFTVIDPVVYAQPWTVETTWIRSDSRIYEYACHEANYALVNILRGGRELERRSAVSSSVNR
jgi:hypothetical protein